MSGIDEQHCNIKVCPKCEKDIITWAFQGVGEGHYNIDLGDNSKLNNTVYLYEGMTFSNIKKLYCYGCGETFDEDTKIFKFVMVAAEKAIKL